MNNSKPSTLHQTLESIVAALIDRLTRSDEMGISEGTVMTPGPPPYRRLDCGGRALAYIRERPRKRAVRVDLSGLWQPKRPSSLQVESSSGSASLMIRSLEEIEEAIAFLEEAVLHTVYVEAQHRKRLAHAMWR